MRRSWRLQELEVLSEQCRIDEPSDTVYDARLEYPDGLFGQPVPQALIIRVCSKPRDGRP